MAKSGRIRSALIQHLSLLERLLAEVFACAIQIDPVSVIQDWQFSAGIRYGIE